MGKEETVTVRIPKVIADYVQKQPWFKLYHDLDDFVTAATRNEKEGWQKATRASEPNAAELIRMFKEARAKEPGLTFADFLDTLSWS